MAIERTGWRPRIDYPPIRFVRFTGSALSEGIKRHRFEGVEVAITDPARTIVDCFRYRAKVGIDVAMEGLREGLRQRKATSDQRTDFQILPAPGRLAIPSANRCNNLFPRGSQKHLLAVSGISRTCPSAQGRYRTFHRAYTEPSFGHPKRRYVMRNQLYALLLLISLLSACGGGSSSGSSTTSTATSTTATVNLVVSDTPSTGITVLAFDVQIASAVLQPGSISLLPKPITVDLAQLVSDSSLLASAIVGSGTYTSLDITLANPQVTILNNTGAALSLNGQSCAVNAVCTYSPVLNNASVTISNGVFPLTVTASSSTGLDLDLSIPDLLQSDLSVTLADGSSVNLALFDNGASAPIISDVLGTITAVNADSIQVTTALGNSLVLTQSDSTSYQYPSAVCASANAACLAVGQVITAGLTLAPAGALDITTLSYLGASGTAWARTWVLGSASTAATPTVPLLVLTRVNASSLTPGAVATVSLPSAASYAIRTANYPGVAGGSFAGTGDLVAGQEVIVNVGPDLAGGTSPTFSADSLNLVASQFVGLVEQSIPAASHLELISLPGLFTYRLPYVQTLDVQTGASTDFIGYGNTGLASVSAGHFAAVKGPVFNTTGSLGYPTLSAVQVRARATAE